MENGNLNVMGGEFNPVLISTSGISFANCFDNCQHKTGRVCSAQGRAAAGRSLGHFNVISKTKKKGTRVHKFQENQKEEGKELWSPLLLLPTLCVSGLLIRVKSCSPFRQCPEHAKKDHGFVGLVYKVQTVQILCTLSPPPVQPCCPELCACAH